MIDPEEAETQKKRGIYENTTPEIFSDVDPTLIEEEFHDSANAVSTKPNYIKEFTIKVRALKIDRSLPGIFPA